MRSAAGCYSRRSDSAAYYLLVSLAVFDAVLLTRREVNQRWLRAGGWLLSMLGVTTFAALATPGLSPGPVIGAGGYLGVTGKALLQTQFANVGTYILTVSMIFGGLLLCTDYALVRLLAWTLAKPTRGLGRGVLQVGAAYAQKLNQRQSDLDDFDTARDGGKVAIRMSGRLPDKEDTVDAETQAQNQEEDPEEDKAATSGGGRKTFASRVGISRPKPTSPTHPEVLEEMDESDLGRSTSDYELPSMDLLVPGETVSYDEQEKEVRRKAQILEKTFLDFGFNIRVVEIQTGPVIAQFEVELEAGLRLSRITSLADDLAIALRVPSVRIVAAVAGQKYRRHRSAQQRALYRPSPRSDGGNPRQDPENADSPATWARTWPAVRWWST